MTPDPDPRHLAALELAVGWIDDPVWDGDGRLVGRVDAVLCDARGRPWWLVLRRRGLRRRTALAPFDGAAPTGSGLTLPWPSAVLDAAPQADPDDLTAAGHAALARHYGLDESRPDLRRRGDCAPRFAPARALREPSRR